MLSNRATRIESSAILIESFTNRKESEIGNSSFFTSFFTSSFFLGGTTFLGIFLTTSFLGTGLAFGLGFTLGLVSCCWACVDESFLISALGALFSTASGDVTVAAANRYFKSFKESRMVLYAASSCGSLALRTSL